MHRMVSVDLGEEQIGRITRITVTTLFSCITRRPTDLSGLEKNDIILSHIISIVSGNRLSFTYKNKPGSLALALDKE